MALTSILDRLGHVTRLDRVGGTQGRYGVGYLHRGLDLTWRKVKFTYRTSQKVPHFRLNLTLLVNKGACCLDARHYAGVRFAVLVPVSGPSDDGVRSQLV